MRVRASYPGLSVPVGSLPGQNDPFWFTDENGVGTKLARAAALDLSAVQRGGLDLVLTAASPGVDGNDIAVIGAGCSPRGSGVVVTMSGTTGVTITWENGVSTVGDVATAVNTAPGCPVAATGGTAGHVLTSLDEFPESRLSGGTDSVAVGLGHRCANLNADVVYGRLQVTDWGAVTDLEIAVESTDDPTGQGGWTTVVPAMIFNQGIPAGGGSLNVYVNGANGTFGLKAATGTTPIRLEMSGLPAARWRCGVRDLNGVGGGAFSCVMAIDFVQNGRW